MSANYTIYAEDFLHLFTFMYKKWAGITLPIMFAVIRISNFNQSLDYLPLNETTHINVNNILRYSIPVVSFIADCILLNWTGSTNLVSVASSRCILNTCCDNTSPSLFIPVLFGVLNCSIGANDEAVIYAIFCD